MKPIQHSDWMISRTALVMALSFLCIHYMAGKLLTPLLLAALLSLLFNPYELVPSLLVILSWFYVCTLVIIPKGRNRYRTGFALGCLGVAAAFPSWLYTHRPAPSMTALAWYGIPATIFVLSTLIFIRLFYFTEEVSNSEISTK